MNDGLLKRAGIATHLVSDEQAMSVFEENGGEENTQFSIQSRINELHKAENIIREWVNSGVRNKSFRINLPERVRKQIRNKIGRDFETHNITANRIAHAYKNHGENGEKLDYNSIPIRKSDLELIPYIMTSPSYIEKGSTKKNRESVRFYKKLENGYVVVVEKEKIDSYNDLETINMWGELSDGADAITNPDKNARNVLISRSDIAKIKQDAEIAIKNDEKLSTNQSNLSTSKGLIYGYAQNGEIYLTERGLNPNTPVHEYTHLWVAAMMKRQTCIFFYK